jgi:hypothetical protein
MALLFLAVVIIWATSLTFAQLHTVCFYSANYEPVRPYMQASDPFLLAACEASGVVAVNTV